MITFGRSKQTFMNTYYDELPNSETGLEYPKHMDSADMYLNSKKHFREMQALRNRLLTQIEQRGFTNCGLTSIEQVEKIFGRYK
jgi:hypothetical protein